MRRFAAVFAMATSACAISGAQRAARLSRGGVGGARRAQPLVGMRLATAGVAGLRQSSGTGGPALLTEDRQKPGGGRAMPVTCADCYAAEGTGTRNTVPSIAFVGAERACRCGSWDDPSRSP
jgi:hypothetical protein